MKHISLKISLFIVTLFGGIAAASDLPNCLSDVRWNNCLGTITMASGNKYVGEWLNNKLHGQGTYIYLDGATYVGEFKYGDFDGQGKYTHLDGMVEEGNWKESSLNGEATTNWPSGDKYVGNYINDKKSGQGTYTWADGSKYIGEWKDDDRSGQGTITMASGNKYVGQFTNNTMNGQGAYTWADGSLKEGIWKDGKFQYAKTPTTNTDRVHKAYIAYYGRPADPVGLNHWVGQLNNGATFGVMLNQFGTSAEAATLFGNKTNTDKVNTLFQQILGRDADFEGLTFYAGKLQNGSMTGITIAQNILDGATGSDKTMVDNKIAVAKAFNTSLDTVEKKAAYAGADAVVSLRNMLSLVGSSTVPTQFDVEGTINLLLPCISGSDLPSGYTAFMLHTPSKTCAKSISSIGVSSSVPKYTYGQSTINFTPQTYNSHTSNSLRVFKNLTPTQHLSDTKAITAWNLGWSGKGASIAVIDDFRSVVGTKRYRFSAERQVDFFGKKAKYNVNYYVDTRFTHGHTVASIAGGDGGAQKTTTRNIEVNNYSKLGCVGFYSNYTGCRQISSGVYRALREPSSEISYVPVPGIARSALVALNHVDTSAQQDLASSLSAMQGHVDNSSDFSVINLSLGLNIQTSGTSFAQAARDATRNHRFSKTTDAVVVVALGNSGAPCASADLRGCNALAVAVTVIPELKKSAIVVGALEGSGTSEGIASYSTRAGVLASRAMLAHGSTGFFNTSGNEVKGTSFAAPRVAGAAAILRQKFPNLSGMEASNILLLTASKDINSDGVNDFKGVSSTYGHGKLDLLKALSPSGSLAIK